MDKLESDTDSKGFKRLRNEVSKRIGVDYENYSKSHLRRRFHARMRVVETPKFTDYLNYLKRNDEEIEKLRKLLTVNVTKFKRDEDVWEIIEDEVIPQIIDKKNDEIFKKIKVWSAGCATGEEPYSLAISFLNNQLPENISIQIYGTDLDNQALDFARNGVYPDKSVKNLSKMEKKEFFIQKNKGWILKDKIKDLVKFEKKDIFKTEFKRKFDLILCRNLMIYFNNDSKADLMKRLVESLNKGGFLIIGMAENLRAPAKDDVESYDLKKRIFVKP
ncbi:MAG: protein-glutamate O-methyltransferase CheR [Candidatus Thermoplasmatota archaeon]|nr:protein-glutamate O-methyltransferase CheR [Candidatus Thermoplasmatota archaeon]MBS3790280.1 protein-glutamate O-methyltransferase CheR [Candidatus Thermoplasmatota archaeon]